MKKNKLRYGVFMATTMLAAYLHASQVFAEEAQIIQLSVGETLELTTGTVSNGAEFSWILTKDRKFLSGQRTKFFQTRLVDTGTYTLDVSIQNSETGENALHTFTIIVGGNTSTSLPPETNLRELPLRAIVATQPPTVSNTIYLPPQGGIVKIDPSTSEGKIDAYWIDLDSTIDSDNDGTATNDYDNVGTLSEKGGTPIYLYALPKQVQRSIGVTVQDLSGAAPSSIQLPLQFSTAPLSTVGQTDGSILIEKNDLTISPSVPNDTPSLTGKQLLYEWDFGDKNRSLLTSPTHSYQAGGTYIISLVIRDISNAEVLQSLSQAIQVSEPVYASSSSASSVSSSSNIAENAGGSFSVWSMIKVLFIIFFLLALSLGLYASIVWIKKRSTQSIQQTLEKMEGNIVKGDRPEVMTQAPAPMNLKKDIVEVSPSKNPVHIAEREKSRPELQTEKRTIETPVVSAGPVPAWLKNAPEPKAKTPPPAPTATPASKPYTPPTKAPLPPVSPAIQKPVTPPAPAPKTADTTSNQGPVPAWLKPTPEPKSDAPTTGPKTDVPVSAPKVAEKNPVHEKPAQPLPVPSSPQQKQVTPIAPKPAPTPIKEPSLPKSGEIPKQDTPSTPVPKQDSDPTIAIIKADSLS